ncbi:YihY/virulence factor BrkB family protein [Halomarina ordinaria]|uniref:YihY/virulence factor BrkB family protein n=1 Tax=Halomarina ordinaria TaxID=3033939 RepID=A0ABD5U836_9EURY|nr:YihY/virulence factor BrkB family protein [Halomarina sp. PSRA2]
MPPAPRTTREALTRIQVLVRRRGLSLAAAGIAYYALVSLIPLLVLAVVVLTAVAGDEVASFVLRQAGEILSPSGRATIRETVRDASGRTGAFALGSLVLLWSSVRLFRGLDTAVAVVYDTPEDDDLLGQFVDAVVVLVTILALAGVLAGVDLAVGLSESLHTGVLRGLVQLVALTVALLPLYYVLPDVSLPVRETLPGAVVAAGGWTVLGTAFETYAATVGTSLYGALTGIVVFVTWLYFSALVLLLGAAVNVVLAGRD